MLATRQPVLRRFWYPVLPAAELDAGPRPVTLLGERLVVWRDAAGVPAALADRCCHRTAALSRGRVGSDGLACPYHGWVFDGAGRCVRIPQARDPARPTKARVAAFQAAIRYDYVWVCLGEPLMPIPEIPEAADPAWRFIHQIHETWDCSGLRMTENLFDNAHFAFVHAATFGDAGDPLPARSRLEETDFGFEFHSVVPIKVHPLQRAVLKVDGDASVRHVHSTFWLPFMRKFKVTYPSGVVHCIVTAATPVDDRTSLICQFALRNDSEADAPAAQVNAFDRLVMDEDRAVLEATQPDVPLAVAGEGEYGMTSDRPGLLIRRKLAALLAAHGETESRAG